MSIFRGLGVAIVTPMNEDKSINYDELKRLIDFQLENKTDAIIVCGTTGEASTLTDDEQIECIRFTVDAVNKRAAVIAGAGSNHTEHGFELTKRSYEAGADAALLVTPYYNKTTQKGLIEHYTYIAKSVDIPIIIYSVAARTGLNIAPKTVLELSKIENIVAIKEASANITQVAEIASLCGDNIDIYSGVDEQNIPILSLGGIGVISVVANLIPKDVKLAVDSFLSRDTETAKNLQLKMMKLIHALFIETSPIPVKAALNLMGYNVGSCKMPLTTMEPANYEYLSSAMKEYGIIS